MIFMTFHILGISSSQLTFIFFGGVAQPPTSVVLMDVIWRLWISLNGSSWDVTGLSLIFFLLLMIWMRCDWILRNFRSECCCVLFLQFWTVEQDASSKKCDEMCCQDGLAFSIWDFTIKHIQISTSSILKRRIWWGLQWSLSTENSEFANRLLKLTLRVSVYIFKTHGFPGKKTHDLHICLEHLCYFTGGYDPMTGGPLPHCPRDFEMCFSPENAFGFTEMEVFYECHPPTIHDQIRLKYESY